MFPLTTISLQYSKKQILWVIIGIALCIRLVIALTYAGDSRKYWTSGDAQYDLIAQNVVGGKGYFIDGNDVEGLTKAFTGKEKIYSFRSPLYPYLLAALYLVFGHNVLVVAITQAVLSSLTILCLFLIAKRLFNENNALLAAVLLTVYPYSLHHDMRIFDTCLFEVLTAVLVLEIIRFKDTPDTRHAVMIGLFLGLAVLCRSAFITFSPFLIIPFAFALHFDSARIVKMLAIVFIIEMVVVSPWLIRNYAIHKKLVFSTYGGWNFYLGNNELALKEVRARKEIDSALSHYLQDSGISLKKLSETEMDAWFFRQGLDFIRQHPLDFLRLLWLKTINLWSIFLNPPSDSRLKELVYTLSYGTVLALSIPGIFLSFKHWRRYLLVYILFVYFTASYIPFITVTRYRKPLDPYLVMFAIFFLQVLVQSRRNAALKPISR